VVGTSGTGDRHQRNKQDKKIKYLLDLYNLMAYIDLEFGNVAMHNSFYFLVHGYFMYVR